MNLYMKTSDLYMSEKREKILYNGAKIFVCEKRMAYSRSRNEVNKRNNKIMENQLIRIFSDKSKAGLSIVLILLPSIEIFQYLWYEKKFGMELPESMYATFLSAATIGHVLQILLLWFLPLYLLILTGVDSIDDYRLGYRWILTAKMGKKAYLGNKLKFSFFTAFLLLFLGLMLNFFLSLIVFRSGTYMPFDRGNMPDSYLFQISYAHPGAANLIFILVVSFLAGLVSSVGTMLSIVLHDKKIVFPVTFALWFGLILPKNSLMLVMQPFAEYDFDTLVPIFLWTVGLYLIILLMLYIWEVKIAEI